MKNHIYTAVVSIVVTLFAVHAYFVYQINKQTTANTQAITQIVSFINQATAQPTPTAEIKK